MNSYQIERLHATILTQKHVTSIQFSVKIYTVSHKRSQLIFVCNFVKNQRILMQFSLLYLEMNGMTHVVV